MPRQTQEEAMERCGKIRDVLAEKFRRNNIRLAVYVSELKDGGSVWVKKPGKKKGLRVYRGATWLPDQVVIPKGIYADAMGKYSRLARNTEARVIDRKSFGVNEYVNVVLEMFAP